MLSNLYKLPKNIWITYSLFKETIIEEVVLLEASYDKFGYKSLYYRTKTGSLYMWNREHPEVELFETKQQAIDSVENGNYSII
jgi:hypothetical protein